MIPVVLQLGFALPTAEQIIGLFVLFVEVLMVFGGLGAVVYFLWYKKAFSKYPIDVDIFQPRASGGLVLDKDKLRRVKTKEKEYFQFKKRGIEWIPPSFEKLVLTKKGKSKIYLLEPTRNQFQIVTPNMTNPDGFNFKTFEEESLARFYKTTEDRRAEDKWRKKNTIDKLIPVITVAIVGVAMALIFYAVFTYGVNPLVEASRGINDRAIDVLETASTVLEKSTEYVERVRPIPLP